MVMKHAPSFGATTGDRMALDADNLATAQEADEAKRLLLSQRATRRAQIGRVNDPMQQLLAKSGALTHAPWDTPNAAENKTFWDNNTRLSQIAGLEGGGVSRPEGAQLLGHVGPTIGGGGGGSYGSQPFSSLLNASSRGGGEVTMSPGGNYSRGPAMDDMEIEKLKQARIATQGMEESLPSVASDRARTSAAFNKNTGIDEEMSQHYGDVKRGEEIRNARQYFQPDVAAKRESIDRGAADQTYERYVRGKEIEAAAKLDAEDVKQRGAMGVQDSRAETARYVAQITNMERAAGELSFDDPQRMRLEAVIEFLKQQMGPQIGPTPQGLGGR